MNQRTSIYTMNKAGELSEMAASAPESEDYMQDIVARYPEIISAEDGELLLIKREQGIGDGDTNSRWSVDHLFVTRAAVPVLVEIKRAVDTRLRREVVGQMLDYAANATAYWRAGQIASSFADNARLDGDDPDEKLTSFIGSSMDPDDFWRQVDANFSAGRIKLVFVADIIPRELARIVEFLNEQMRANVSAVELNWFENQNGEKAFTPRIIGATERAMNEKAARSGKTPMTKEQWIGEYITPNGQDTLDALAHFEAIVVNLGGVAELTSSQGSIISTFNAGKGKFYPYAFSRNSSGIVQFNLAYIKSQPAFSDEAIRRRLYDQLSKAVGPLSTQSLNGYPAFKATQLNDANIRAEFTDFTKSMLKMLSDKQKLST